MRSSYDVIVIGGGHAGVEAAWAAASVLGADGRVALVTMDPSKIGTMSCNPAIGGLAKGQMVREVDALGGLMGLATDATGIMFKMLNQSKGAAVRGPRAQCDKYAYAAEVQRLISTRTNIDVIAGTVDEFIVEDGHIAGIVLPAGAGIIPPDPIAIEANLKGDNRAIPIYRLPATSLASSHSSSSILLRSSAVVLTTGTFMRALMHTGEAKSPGGRVGEGSAVGVSAALRSLGFELGRLKTGTPPRLARESLDWESLEAQHGDDEPAPFSDLTGLDRFPISRQIHCRITHTTAAMHDLIRANLHRAPMYSGQIDAECGPRYCPSIEDKVVRFAHRGSHQVFLEPESLHGNEIYCNGISTSLPGDVQESLVRSMAGCDKARILRLGYAVEYDMIWPHQIDSTGMTKLVAGLFTAGQINGTSGYEEAAGQGLIAGLNAARLSRGEDLVRLGRDQAYIGVMLDDLVTKTPREPYRMFTSRAEHRLMLRGDNADQRLTPLGRELGLVDGHRWAAFERRQCELDRIRRLFDQILVEGRPLREIARRPELDLQGVLALLPVGVEGRLADRVLTECKYEGYIHRQRQEVHRQARADDERMPAWLNFAAVSGLRAEAVESLAKFRPQTLGQAGRLAGVTPADLTLLAIAIRRGPPPVNSADRLQSV